ncbi:MAG TPA: hypothetical protein VFO79_12995 [Xanthomonadales bacterium]|nr:hypothetical protein [Xanthomonadales bacterium]
MSDQGAALQQRINRIAADLAASTGKPLRFWLEETARMIARDAPWTIRDTPGGEEVVILEDDTARG